jgi:serine-type D-Ala-D-Ala carboxypeptidase/endopeptidase (penicillin-binding protein 4)
MRSGPSRNVFPIAAGLALLAGLAAARPAPEPLTVRGPLSLQAEAERIVAGASGEWSVLAWAVERDEPLFAIDANQARILASNTKVFTSIWALEVLGEDHRFPTDLLVTAPIGEDGVLHGDVVLRGSGDPAFGNREFNSDPMAPLRTMARELHARGLRQVQGNVMGDASAFDTVKVGPEWPLDTSGGAAAYAPRVSGLAFGRNLLWVELTPTTAGQAPHIRTEPQMPEIPMHATVRTGGGRAVVTRHPNSDTILVRGGVSGRGPFRYGIGVTQPALLAAGALRQALEEEGIVVHGRAVSGTPTDTAYLVHRHFSMPLLGMVAKLNRDSDNFFAEHLFKAAAAEVIGVGSYTAAGAASALFFIERAGVPYGQIYLADGSGLSRFNHGSAFSLVRALQFAADQPWFGTFDASLAVAGERQGTMRRMFVGTPGYGKVRGKTGFIRGVRTLSGFVESADGEQIAFAFLYNGSNTNGARLVQQELANLLAQHGRPGG